MKRNPKRTFLTSGEIAKERTGLTVSADRLDSRPERMDELRREVTAVLAKYINTEDDNLKVSITFACDTIRKSGQIGKRGRSDVKTIQIK